MSGFSGTPLIRKLGLKDGMRAMVINSPVEYLSWLTLPANHQWTTAPPFDFVHLFTNDLSELEVRLHQLRNEITSSGMIWVSWYKRASGEASEITEDLVRATCLPLGLVDIKVCSVSDKWSGLQLVIRRDPR